MPKSSSTNLGIIGCGHVVDSWHLPALRRVGGLRVAALADTDADRLQLVADRWGVRHRFTDGSELIRDPDIEAVAVCVPAAFHARLAVEALEAGKHLMVEKPLALSVDDCDLILAAAERSDAVALVGFNLRWHRLVRKTIALLDEHRLGRVQSIRSVFTCGQEHEDGRFAWRKRRADGGGTLIEMAVHHFDLWRLLGGGDVVEVQAFTESRRSEDDAAAVAARLAGGVLAGGTFGEGTGGQNAFELFGQRGRLEIELTRVDGLRWFHITSLPGDPRAHVRRLANTLGSLRTAIGRWPAASDWERSFIGMWRHFNACTAGEAEIGCTLTDGLRAVQVALAAAASATNGRPVAVAEAPRSITPPPNPRPIERSE